MSAQNYYELLEVPHTATFDEIATAYKKMVRIWHPDKTSFDKNIAAQKFKLITKAYSVLSKEHSRKHYDLHNVELNDSTNTCIDPFESFKNELDDNSVPNVIVYVDATIYELYTGVSKVVTFSRYSPCANCNGYGTQNKLSCPCRKCDGKGLLIEFVQGGVLGYMVNQKICDVCCKTGIDPSADICDTCNGIKYAKEDVDATVVIPAGAYSKYIITHESEGNFVPYEEQKDGKSRTNALFVVNELISQFKRGVVLNYSNDIDMANVLLTINISFEEAMCGFEKCIDHINSNQINIIVSDIVQNNDIFVMKNMGMPKINLNSNELMHGHLFVKFNVQCPSLSIKQKRKLWQLLTNTAYSTFDYSKISNISRFENTTLL